MPAPCKAGRGHSCVASFKSLRRSRIPALFRVERAILTIIRQLSCWILYCGQGNLPNRTLDVRRRSRRKEYSNEFQSDGSKLIVLAVTVILVIIVAVVLYMRKRKKTTAELRDRFGTEYDRAVHQHGSERRPKQS